jgi:hypothetical protein
VKNFALTILCASVPALPLGCDAPSAEPQPIAFRPGEGSSSAGGVFLNTNAIGAHALSELDLGGEVHEGVRLDAVRIKLPGDVWLTLESVDSEAGELVGVHDSVTYRGAEFLDSEWDLTFIQGVSGEIPATMYIAAYTASGAHKYTFKYDDAAEQPHFVCDADPDGAYGSVAIPDISVHAVTGEVVERPDTLYLGCTSGAVGKAVVWGYAPWDIGAVDFETAVRVVRADYCATGASWTLPGTYLQLADAWDVNAFLDAQQPTEALWGPGGALCVGAPRLDEYIGAVTCGGLPLPSCASEATLADTVGALFWTKLAP